MPKALLDAIDHDDAPEVERLVKAGEPINLAFGIREIVVTYLDYAIDTEKYKAASALLRLGANPDHPQSERPALFCAIYNDNADWVLNLIRAGADLNRRLVSEHFSITPASLAAASTAMNAWTVLMAEGADILPFDVKGRSILFYAADGAEHRDLQKAYDIIKYCLSKGVDINHRDKFDCTATILASEYGSNVAKIFLDNGADPMLVGKNGLTFLIAAMKSRRSHPFSEAIKVDSNVNAQDVLGRTALHYAVKSTVFRGIRCLEEIQQLISYGANVNIADKRGRTPLMYLLTEYWMWSKRRKDEVLSAVRTILDNGQDLYAKDREGNGLWHFLVYLIHPSDSYWSGDTSMYIDLFKFSPLGKPFKMPPYSPLPPLYKSFCSDQNDPALAEHSTALRPYMIDDYRSDIGVSCARILLAYPGGDANIDERNERSLSPLLILCDGGPLAHFDANYLELLRILLARRADVFVTDEEGNTPLILLCRRDWYHSDDEIQWLKAAVEAICTRNVDVNAKNFSGETALSVSYHPEIKQILKKYGAKASYLSYQPIMAEPLEFREPRTDIAPLIEIECKDDYIPLIDDSFLDKLYESDNDSIYDIATPEYTTAATYSQPINGGGESPIAKELHPHAYKMYQEANSSYQSDANRVFPHINLVSGRRTVQQQVVLYRDFIEATECGGPEAHRANHPGSSWHNYGMAIDVVRGSDENRLTTALTATGWVAAVEDEGWHFEAQSGNAWNLIDSSRTSRVEPLSKDIANNIVDFVLYRCYIRRNEAEYRRQEQEIQQQRNALSQRRSNLARDRGELNQRSNDLSREANNIAQEDSNIAALRQRYDSMVYRCPNGLDYDHCTDHPELKRRFKAEKDQLWSEIQRRQNSLNSKKNKLATDKQNWSIDDRNLRQEESKLVQEEGKFRKSQAEFDKFKRRMEYWIKRKAHAESAINSLTHRIQSEVNQIVNETSVTQ